MDERDAWFLIAQWFLDACDCQSRMRWRACCGRACAPSSCAASVAPPPPKMISQKVKYQAETLFDFDKSVLKPEGRAKLDDLAEKIKGIDLEVIVATGHT